jgi:RND family efflux transporter MFP subunit
LKGLKTFLSICVGALALAGCVDRESQKQAKVTERLIKDPTAPVRLAPVGSEDLVETLEITGQLTTSADTTVGARVSGRLVAVYVQDGDAVSAGQVIAEQDASILRSQAMQAQSQVAAARASLDQAISNAKIGPQKSAAAVATAEAQLRGAKAQLAKARQGARKEEVAQAEAQVNAARASLDTAKKERDRAKSLFEQGAGSQQRYEAAESGYQNALSNYESALENLRMRQSWTRPEDLQAAEEQVRQAEEALRSAKAQQSLDVLLGQQVEQARANLRAAESGHAIARQALADAQVRSPISGRLFGKPAQPGEFLNPGAPVARIVGGSGVYFEGEVPETQVASVRPGSSVRVVFDALPGATATGTVIAVSPSSAEVARVFKVRVGLSSVPEGAKPGMFAHGEITLRSVKGAAVVPQAAIVRQGSDAFVFTVDGKKAKRIKVTTGLGKNGVIQVIGLEPGTLVVSEGASELADGQEVAVESKSAAEGAKKE